MKARAEAAIAAHLAAFSFSAADFIEESSTPKIQPECRALSSPGSLSGRQPGEIASWLDRNQYLAERRAEMIDTQVKKTCASEEMRVATEVMGMFLLVRSALVIPG